ncbi:alpha/beta hydrolase [Desulforhopalus sp. 52FAK]
MSICLISSASAEELIELKVAGGISHKSLLFQSGLSRAVVLVHQSGKTAESWRQLATVLADRGVTSLALFSISPDDVAAAVRYLEMKKFEEITLVGASLGGSAITQALAANTFDTVISVVLLAPATGPAMTSAAIKKMIIVAKSDFYKSRAYTSFEEAVKPKILKEYDGTEHGQALLNGFYSQQVLQEIFNFLDIPTGDG